MEKTLMQRLRTVPISLFAAISVLLSEILTSLMSILLQGKVTYDYLITGGVVSLVVSAIVVYFIRQVSMLADHNEILRREVSHRKKAEEALRESEERFKRLVQNSNDIITVANENGIQTSISGPIEKLLGYKPEELIGTSGFDMIHPDDLESAMKIFTEALMHPGAVGMSEFRSRHKNGSWVAMEAVGTNLLHDPVVKGLVLNIRDISERNKLQEQLQQAMKMEAVGRLAGGVAHDFNNMLGAIIGYAEMALMRVSPETRLAYELKEILKAAQRSANLTRQLLAFARKQTVSPKVLNLNDTISNTLMMLRRLIGEDINLSWIQGTNLWKVRMDPSQIDQILANLAVNARDAISGVGSLILKTENFILADANRANYPGFVPGEYVLLSVSDTGSGMTEEVLEHLFEPFFTTKEIGKGSGLGLATIYGIVKQNNGFIDVESKPGKGTTFRIYVPRSVGEVSEASVQETVKELQGGTETILLVEDDEGILDLGKEILEGLGYRVLTAQTPTQAIHLVTEHKEDIHLLVTDIVMPEMNGRELVEHISAIKPGLKCLYMSGYPADVIAHQGVLDQGFSFIQKPFRFNDFAKAVRGMMERK